MRWLPVLLLAFAGCQQGGGAGGAGRLPAAEFQRAEQVVVDCGADVIRTQLETLHAILANFDFEQDEAPRFVFTFINGPAIHWQLDTDGDTLPDFTGALTFTDDQGVPSTPFALSQLLTSNDRLPTFLAAIAEGRCIIDYTSAGAVGVGSLVTTIKTGTPGRLTGGGALELPGCSARFVVPGTSTLVLAQPELPLFFRLDVEFLSAGDRIDLIVSGGNGINTVAVDAYVNDPARTGPHDRFEVTLTD